jgi:hypothetical protein
MTWTLYIIFGMYSASLQFQSNYSTEAVCKQAAKALEEKSVRAVCLPKENLK